MERRGVGQLIIVVGLSLMSAAFTSGVDDHHDYDDDVINAARCRVRCLSLLQVGQRVGYVYWRSLLKTFFVAVMMRNGPKIFCRRIIICIIHVVYEVQ